MKTVTFIFNNQAQAMTFMSWFSNSGEQDYGDQANSAEDDDEFTNGFDYDFKEQLITAI